VYKRQASTSSRVPSRFKLCLGRPAAPMNLTLGIVNVRYQSRKSTMANRNSVPHHRVSAALHTQAKTKAETHGVSMSAVAAAGLNAYAERADQDTIYKATEQVKSGRLQREVSIIPDVVTAELVRLFADKDSRFVSYLHALHIAGWAYAALAEPLKLSRQAVHLRLAKFDPSNAEAIDGLPIVPGPGHGNARGTVEDLFDWAIWVERDIYAIAAARATHAGESMRTVMESILTGFIAGTITVAASASKTESTKSTNRKAK
jgi:hypothetical protein